MIQNDTLLAQVHLEAAQGGRDDEVLGSNSDPADFCPILPPKVQGKYKTRNTKILNEANWWPG